MQKILVGLTSSISGFKVLDLLPKFLEQGFDLEMVFTQNASKMFDVKEFEKILKKPIYTDLFFTPKDLNFKYQNYLKNQKPINHIYLADSCDLILICPATSNIIAKLANGICDDLLTSVVSASNKPVLICPAMNVKMWENPILQYNLQKLQRLDKRFSILEPENGDLACGYTGKGRLANNSKIFETSLEILKKHSKTAFSVNIDNQNKQQVEQKVTNLNKDLELGLKKNKIKEVLITAGGTSEKIDEIRFITNKSTGKMGISLAQVCLEKKYRVKLLLAKNTNWSEIIEFLQVDYPFLQSKNDFLNQENLEIQTFTTSDELSKLIKSKLKPHQIVIHTAAVSDFILKNQDLSNKIPSSENLSLEFVPLPKILSQIKLWKPDCFLISFKLEINLSQEELIQKAQKSLQKNNSDMVVANLVTPKTGFESDTNEVWIVLQHQIVHLGLDTKIQIAKKILDILEVQFKKLFD